MGYTMDLMPKITLAVKMTRLLTCFNCRHSFSEWNIKSNQCKRNRKWSFQLPRHHSKRPVNFFDEWNKDGQSPSCLLKYCTLLSPEWQCNTETDNYNSSRGNKFPYNWLVFFWFGTIGHDYLLLQTLLLLNENLLFYSQRFVYWH